MMNYKISPILEFTTMNNFINIVDWKFFSWSHLQEMNFSLK